MKKSAPDRVRILLIDDHVLFRESLARLLQSEQGFTVVGHCGSGAEAMQVLKSRTVDVVLLDLDLGPEKGADVLDDIRALPFEGKVLLVTAGVDERDVPGLIRKGIAGILKKHNSPALLVQGIRDAMAGKVSFQQDLLQRALEVEIGQAAVHPTKLTKREKDILSFIFEGFSNKEIANRLHISESAVKASLQNLFSKTGVRTRSQLVRVALEQYRDQL
jgi:two-component system, NarL family, nitrate/nitrite response regulator NarL